MSSALYVCGCTADLLCNVHTALHDAKCAVTAAYDLSMAARQVTPPSRAVPLPTLPSMPRMGEADFASMARQFKDHAMVAIYEQVQAIVRDPECKKNLDTIADEYFAHHKTAMMAAQSRQAPTADAAAAASSSSNNVSE